MLARGRARTATQQPFSFGLYQLRALGRQPDYKSFRHKYASISCDNIHNIHVSVSWEGMSRFNSSLSLEDTTVIFPPPITLSHLMLLGYLHEPFQLLSLIENYQTTKSETLQAKHKALTRYELCFYIYEVLSKDPKPAGKCQWRFASIVWADMDWLSNLPKNTKEFFLVLLLTRQHELWPLVFGSGQCLFPTVSPTGHFTIWHQ